MSLTHAQGKHIHFPATPDKFEFDAEVATIFDSMALRSIPMYAEVHRMHVEMFADKFVKGAVVADIGASTGNFFTQIELQIGKHEAEMADPNLFTKNPNRFAALAAEMEKLRGSLEKMEEEWLELEMLREELEG